MPHRATLLQQQSSTSTEAQQPLTSWREKVDLLLNPRLTFSERETLTKDLLNDIPQIRDDVKDAVDRGGARAVLKDVIFAPGSEARRTASGIRSVQRQVREDILPELKKEAQNARKNGGSADQVRSRVSSLLRQELPDALRKAVQDFPDQVKKADFSPQGACKAAETVKEEAINAVSRTPAGLYTPSYICITCTRL